MSSDRISSVVIRPSDTNKLHTTHPLSYSDVRFTLHSLRSLEKLVLLATPSKGENFVPFSSDWLQIAPANVVRHLTLSGPFTLPETHTISMTKLCPHLETLCVASDPSRSAHADLVEQLHDFPETLTALELAGYRNPQLFPSSLTKVKMSAQCHLNPRRNTHSVFQALSMLPNLVHLHLETILDALAQQQDSITFPQLKTLHLEEVKKAPISEIPVRRLQMPKLDSLSVVTQSSLLTWYALPPTLTHLSIIATINVKSGYVGDVTTIPRAAMLAMPPLLKSLYLAGPLAVSQDPSNEWFAHLPISIRKIVAPQSLVDWNSLPPALERIICASLDLSHFSEGIYAWPSINHLPARPSAAPSRNQENTPVANLTSPLPSSLTEIVNDVQGLFKPSQMGLLPQNLGSLKTCVDAEDWPLEAVKTLLYERPDLHLWLYRPSYALPSPIHLESGKSTFSLSSYFQKEALKRDFTPSQIPRVHINYHLPEERGAFELPLGLKTLDWSAPEGGSLGVFKENLPRLCSLTSLSLKDAKSLYRLAFDLSTCLKSLPLLEVLKADALFHEFSFEELPRGLRYLEISLPEAYQPKGGEHLSTTGHFAGNGFGSKTFLAFSEYGFSYPKSSAPSSLSDRTADISLPALESALDIPYEPSKLPQTLTTAKISGFKFPRSSAFQRWPKALEHLTLVTSGWTEQDVAHLKEGLPHIKTLDAGSDLASGLVVH